MKNILITGGAGYIGSHICIELLNANYNPIIIDNFSNSSEKVIKRIEKITQTKIKFFKCNLGDKKKLIDIIKFFNCEAVLHLSGRKYVNESTNKPLLYYFNNVSETISLLEAMIATSLKKIIFSSSATIYGKPKNLPISENHPLSPENVYGETKLIIENMLKNVFNSDKAWKICILRYFNPVGAHESGLIGDNPQNIPNNIMPYICQVAIGKREKLKIWGNDYDTIDGTGIRDYIHVVDLAKGHIKALEKLQTFDFTEINLGTGRGYSVLQLINSFEKVTRKNINFEFKERRIGDIDINYANPQKAKNLLDWEAQFDIDRMCEDSWRWQIMNPEGLN